MKDKIIIIWLTLFTAFMVWRWLGPQLEEIHQFKNYEFGGSVICSGESNSIVEAENVVTFNWWTLDWNLSTKAKNPNDCK